jgi:hypothetical protein
MRGYADQSGASQASPDRTIQALRLTNGHQSRRQGAAVRHLSLASRVRIGKRQRVQPRSTLI